MMEQLMRIECVETMENIEVGECHQPHEHHIDLLALFIGDDGECNCY